MSYNKVWTEDRVRELIYEPYLYEDRSISDIASDLGITYAYASRLLKQYRFRLKRQLRWLEDYEIDRELLR